MLALRRGQRPVNLPAKFVIVWNCLARQWLYKRAQAKCSMTAFNSGKRKNESLAVVVRVPQTTQTLLMSRICFADESKEIYKEF